MPRSASRDRSDPFVGRRGYFRRPTRFAVGKLSLSLIALLAASGWAVYDAAADPADPIAHTHGPLADPHAAWESDCKSCHVPFGSAHFTGDPLSAFDARSRWQTLTCAKCHLGPEHRANMNSAGAEWHNRCNNCHKDHAGRMNPLTRLDDSKCVHCHADLHRFAEKQSTSPRTITNFSTDHPPFASLIGFVPAVHRKLKFNHSLHMTEGLAEPTGVKHNLKCESCHTPRTNGDYYQPVRYEMHCVKCHPVNTPTYQPSGSVVEHIAVPHGKPSKETREWLQGRYAMLLTKPEPLAPAPPRLPGGRTEPLPERKVEAQTIRDEVARFTAEAFARIYKEPIVPFEQGCMKCHVGTGEGKGHIEKIPDKSVWLTKAKFDHASHRGANCASCHPGTAAVAQDLKMDVIDQEPVAIAGLANCRTCHAPGAVRHACTDCHAYHNGDHPLAGRGAIARYPLKPTGLDAFLPKK